MVPVGGCVMAELATIFAVFAGTTGAIGLGVWYGTRYIEEQAKEGSISRDRPIVLPPPKHAESQSSL
jgi:hypothetical protein